MSVNHQKIASRKTVEITRNHTTLSQKHPKLRTYKLAKWLSISGTGQWARIEINQKTTKRI